MIWTTVCLTMIFDQWHKQHNFGAPPLTTTTAIPKLHFSYHFPKVYLSPLYISHNSHYHAPPLVTTTAIPKLYLPLYLSPLYSSSCSLVPRPPPVFCSSVCIQYNTRKRKSTYYTDRKPKNKKRGRSGNEARLSVYCKTWDTKHGCLFSDLVGRLGTYNHAVLIILGC